MKKIFIYVFALVLLPLFVTAQEKEIKEDDVIFDLLYKGFAVK